MYDQKFICRPNLFDGVIIPSDPLIAHDDQNVTFPTETKNFVRQIGFYYANGSSRLMDYCNVYLTFMYTFALLVCLAQ